MKKRILGVLSFIFMALLLVACGDGTFKVEFDLNGGTSEAIEAQTIQEGGLVTKPSDPTKDGHTFENWVEEDSLEEWDFTENKVEKNLKLVAQWKIKEYTVNFDVRGGSPEPDAQTINHGSKATKPSDPTLEGNDFLGWFLASEDDPFDFDTAITANVALEARWSLDEYTVSFDPDGGAEKPEDQAVNYNAKATKPADPIKENYSFLGWFEEEATEAYDFNAPVKRNLALKARWELIAYTVSFDVKGGSEVSDQTVAYNTKATKPSDPTREGSTFLGWFLDGEEYDFDELVLEALSLEARWEIDYDQALVALVALYEDTFEDPDWLAVEDVELVSIVNFVPVTWVSGNPEYFSNDGEVTRPAYSKGDQLIQLTAELTPVHSYMFFFLVGKLEETTAEKIEKALDFVTVVPVSPSGYQEENFKTLDTIKIEGEEVEVTWTTSDDTAMQPNGNLVPFVEPDEKDVILTASITYQEITLTREIEFKVKKVDRAAEGFDTALVEDNKDKKIFVPNVIFYTDIATQKDNPVGYYLASKNNTIAYVHGARPKEVVSGKLYDVTFEVDIYFGSFQIKNVVFYNERDGELPTITPKEMTLDEIVNLTRPTDVPFQQEVYSLKSVKVRVDDLGDNYKTFFVNYDLEDDAILTDMNSIMLYYVSDFEKIQALDGKKIKEVIVINNGYRTNNIVWYVNYIGDGSDIELEPLTPEEVKDATIEELGNSIPYRVVKDGKINLIDGFLGSTIEWSSDNVEVIDAETGNVVVPEVATEVKLTATITVEVEDGADVVGTFERTIWVGDYADLELSEVIDLIDYDDVFALMPFAVKAIVTANSGNNTWTVEDASGAITVYSSAKYEIGYEYTFFGVRSLFNGLRQLAQDSAVAAVKGEQKALPEAKVLTEADLKEGIDEYQAHLITIMGLVVESVAVDSYGTIDMVLKIGEETLALRWDNRVVLTPEAKAHLQAIVVGENINLVGAPLTWYNGPQVAYDNIDQIAFVVPETDAGKVDAALAALNLPDLVTEAGDLEFAAEGRFETTIAWTSSNEDVISKTGVIVMPTANETVYVTAKVTFGDVTKEKVFSVYAQVDETLLNVFLARKLAVEAEVKLEGVVSAIAYNVDGDVYYVYVSDQDGTTITLFRPTISGVIVGDKVVVEGEIDNYNGLIQARNATVTKVAGEVAVPETIVLDKIIEFTADDQGKHYSIDNLYVVSVSDRSLFLTDLTNKITAYIDPNVPGLVAYIADFVGKKVNLVDIRLGWYNGGQFLIQDELQVVAEDLTDSDKALMDLYRLSLPEILIDDEDLTLAAKSDHDLDIVWTTSDQDIISDMGVVVLPEEDTVVTLTATIFVGEEEFAKEFEILVKAPIEADEVVAIYDFTKLTEKKGSEITSQAAFLTMLGKVTTSEFKPVKVEGLSKIFEGNGLGGSEFEQDPGVLKTGTSSVNGTMKLTYDKEITKIVLTLRGWGATDDVTINGIKKAAPAAMSTLEFVFVEPTKVLDFLFEKRALIIKMAITYLDEEVEDLTTPIADFLELDVNGQAIIKGIITNVGPLNSFSLEDETGAVAFRIGGKNSTIIDFKVGDELQVLVKKGIFDDLIQAELVGDYEDIEVLSENNPLPALLSLNQVSFDAEDLMEYQSRIVRLDLATITSYDVDSYKNVALTLEREDGETIRFKWDQRVIIEGSEVLYDFEVDDVVNIAGATMSWDGNGPILMIDALDQIQKAEVTSIADFLELDTNEEATIVGIITNVGPHNSYSMEDETGAVAFRISGKNSANIDFKVGDKLVAHVKKGLYNNLIQAELVAGYDYGLLSEGNQLPALVDLNEKSLDAEDLMQYQSRLVKLDNVTIISYSDESFNNVEITLERDDEETIRIKWDSRVIIEGSEVLYDFEVDDVVNIAGATISWDGNGPILMIDALDQIVLVP